MADTQPTLILQIEGTVRATPLHLPAELAGLVRAQLETHVSSLTNSAWHHLLCLHHLDDQDAAKGVIDTHLRWLLDAEPAALDEMQGQIKEQLAGFFQN